MGGDFSGLPCALPFNTRKVGSKVQTMLMEQITRFLDRITSPLTSVLMSAGGGILALMMFLTATDVALRYIFNSPIPGAFELVEYMMAVLVPFGLAYCAREKGHIGVDLVVERLPRRFQLILGCVTTFATFAFFLLVTWQNFFYILEFYGSKQTSAVLLIPRYPFVAMAALAFAILTLILLLQFFQLVSERSRKWNRS
ncbi:MAG: TRAP transporter small permease [Deltaproteobacteria bacterium]|nr:TRAP transporter small permease [Deltaproteobacteria bacterium]